jgi:hypothetical protein
MQSDEKIISHFTVDENFPNVVIAMTEKITQGNYTKTTRGSLQSLKALLGAP